MRPLCTLLLPCVATLAGQGQPSKPGTATLRLAMQLPAAAPVTSEAPSVYHLTGRVFGPLGRPLPGATLALKGAAATTISTDENGRFMLDLPAKTINTLVAGYAGYADQTIQLAPNQPALTVTLHRPITYPTRATKGVAPCPQTNYLAPDFALPTTTGSIFKLSEHRGHPVVLYFYPKDGSPGCIEEACSFRDQYQDFTDLGAEVIGISSDDEQSHQQFTQKYQLPFPLLSDAGGQLRKQYAVPRAVLGLIPGRVTYVLDGAGRVRYVFNSLHAATNHVLHAKNILRSIK